MQIQSVLSTNSSAASIHDLNDSLHRNVPASSTREQDIFREKAKPDFGLLYAAVGESLPNRGNIQIIDGTTVSKQQLFIRAISLNPLYARAYTGLGGSLQGHETAQLHDGQILTRQ